MGEAEQVVGDSSWQRGQILVHKDEFLETRALGGLRLRAWRLDLALPGHIQQRNIKHRKGATHMGGVLRSSTKKTTRIGTTFHYRTAGPGEMVEAFGQFNPDLRTVCAVLTGEALVNLLECRALNGFISIDVLLGTKLFEALGVATDGTKPTWDVE